jgi:hypothetical protein
MASFSEEDPQFQFVFIPAKDSEKIQRLSASKSGGLENDALRKRAEVYFTSKTMDETLQRREMAKQLKENGMTDEQIVEAMSKFGNTVSGNVEIIALGIPTAANSFTSVSIYCDANSRYRTGGDSERQNKRATLLARGCGHKDLTIMGDCFVGRAHDDERVEWQRLDFVEEDVLPTSLWVQCANTANSSKNLSSYSTSGMALNVMEQTKAKPSTVTSAAVTELPDERVPDEGFWWTQDQGEIEVRIPLPGTAVLPAKSLLCTIRASSITIGDKRLNPSEGSAVEGVHPKFTASNGAPLSAEVNVGECSWSIDQEKSGRVLTITLIKRLKQHWKSLLAK